MSKIIADGSYDSNIGKFDVNMSSIWNELLDNIHFVESYKSDVIIDINSAMKVIEKANPEDGFGNGKMDEERWIGFRKNGVDHYDYIKNTVLGSSIFGGEDYQVKKEVYYYYRKLFKLTLKIVGDKMIVDLVEKDVTDFIQEEKKKARK